MGLICRVLNKLVHIQYNICLTYKVNAGPKYLSSQLAAKMFFKGCMNEYWTILTIWFCPDSTTTWIVTAIKASVLSFLVFIQRWLLNFYLFLLDMFPYCCTVLSLKQYSIYKNIISLQFWFRLIVLVTLMNYIKTKTWLNDSFSAAVNIIGIMSVWCKVLYFTVLIVAILLTLYDNILGPSTTNTSAVIWGEKHKCVFSLKSILG